MSGVTALAGGVRLPAMWRDWGAVDNGAWGAFTAGHVLARRRWTAGTIFEGTRKPLRMWFLAMWFVTSQKNGVSALGLQRVLGLGSYETAWTWLHKLRRAMVRPGRDCLTHC